MPMVMQIAELRFDVRDHHTVGMVKLSERFCGPIRYNDYPCVYGEDEIEALALVVAQVHETLKNFQIPKENYRDFSFSVRRSEVKNGKFWSVHLGSPITNFHKVT